MPLIFNAQLFQHSWNTIVFTSTCKYFDAWDMEYLLPLLESSVPASFYLPQLSRYMVLRWNDLVIFTSGSY